MIMQLEGAIASEVQRQVRKVLDDPERLATLLGYSLTHQRGRQQNQERGGGAGVVVLRPEPVGVMEIAERAHVHVVTVRHWRARYSDFPKPAWTVSGQPAWDWDAVLAWLKRPRPVGRPRKREPSSRRSGGSSGQS